jgi:hypothetical protein
MTGAENAFVAWAETAVALALFESSQIIPYSEEGVQVDRSYAI